MTETNVVDAEHPVRGRWLKSTKFFQLRKITRNGAAAE
jgi:hypothetical protein